jgi:hypothetical protein
VVYACDIAARPVEVGDKPNFDWVGSYVENVGIVLVAAFAARAAGVLPSAAMTFT